MLLLVLILPLLGLLYLGTANNSFCDTKNAMKSCFLYSLGFGLLACIVLVLFAKPICFYFLHDQIPFYLFYITAISLPFISLSSCINGYLTALRKNGKNAINRIFEQALKIISTSLLLSFFLPDGLEYACLSLVLGEAISEIGSFFFYFFLYCIERKKYNYNTSLPFHYRK